MTGSTSHQLQASIVPVLYKKGLIEEQNIDITDFAKSLCSRNAKAGFNITRRDIEWYWEGNVRAEFDTVNPVHHRLISQMRCPKFDTYWMNKTATVAFQARRILQEQEGFWLLRPNARERKYFESALNLGNSTERWTIPHVSLLAIENVSFTAFVESIREANADHAGEGLNKAKIFRLWGTLIKKAYDFVPKEVQVKKLREAFSRYPPTTEEGLEEFFGTASKKRKSPSSEGDDLDHEHSGHTNKKRRVSIGHFHVREFDEQSILDPMLKPILKHTCKLPPRATAGPSASASIRSLAGGESGEEGEDVVDKGETRIQALEKELAELKVAMDEVEHKLQSEKGMRKFEQSRNESLQRDLQESRDLVAQLEKRSTEDA